jgi:hypothetical protein
MIPETRNEIRIFLSAVKNSRNQMISPTTLFICQLHAASLISSGAYAFHM